MKNFFYLKQRLYFYCSNLKERNLTIKLNGVHTFFNGRFIGKKKLIKMNVTSR